MNKQLATILFRLQTLSLTTIFVLLRTRFFQRFVIHLGHKFRCCGRNIRLFTVDCANVQPPSALQTLALNALNMVCLSAGPLHAADPLNLMLFHSEVVMPTAHSAYLNRWKILYRAAILETNKEILPQRVSEAEEA